MGGPCAGVGWCLDVPEVRALQRRRQAFREIANRGRIIVTAGAMEKFESGSCSPPDVEMFVYRETGERMTPYEYLAEMKYAGDEIEIVKRLEAEIAGILEAHGIAILPEQEWCKRVPRLRGGEETVLAGQPITVKEAFFFQGI